MPLPTVSDIREELTGYNVTSSIIADSWITKRLTDEVVPFVEEFTSNSFSGIKQVIEYHSGTGKDELMLDRRNIVSVDAIRLVSGNDIDTTINIASIEIIPRSGILKVKSGLSEYYNYRIFPKGNDNIKVTYSYGTVDVPADIARAMVMLTAIKILDHMEGCTGGGQLTGQAYNRMYGNMGKFSNIRKRLNQQAMTILRRYSTGVVGA